MAEQSDDKLRETVWDLVVIGRGYSALVNCMTRYHQGQLPEKTLLVGKEDPWSRYADHPMGQHAPLLALPGYPEDSQPRSEGRNEFLSSAKFGEYNQKQLDFLSDNGVAVATCLIEDPLEFVQSRWLIPMNRDGNSITVAAKKVDFCTGPGPGRLFRPGSGQVFGPWTDGIRDSFDPNLLQHLRDDSGDKIAIGERFMQRDAVVGHVLVVGEGPLTASIAEHALRIGASRVTWVGRPIEMAEISFPASTRYDPLIQNANGVRSTYEGIKGAKDSGLAVDVDKLKNDIAPVDPKLTIVLGRVSAVAANKVILVGDGTFGMYVLTSSNKEHHSSGHSPEMMYDYLVVSASSENSESEKRAAAHLLRSLPKTIAPDAPLNPIERLGVFSGLEVPDGSLRVLGAACRNRTLLEKTRDPDCSEEVNYRNWVSGLSPQVQMPNYAMGITVGAAAVANANEFYSSMTPDECAQTAQLPDGDLKEHRSATPAAIDETNPKLGSFSVFPRPI